MTEDNSRKEEVVEAKKQTTKKTKEQKQKKQKQKQKQKQE